MSVTARSDVRPLDPRRNLMDPVPGSPPCTAPRKRPDFDTSLRLISDPVCLTKIFRKGPEVVTNTDASDPAAGPERNAFGHRLVQMNQIPRLSPIQENLADSENAAKTSKPVQSKTHKGRS